MEKLIYSKDTSNALQNCPPLYGQEDKCFEAIAFVRFYIPFTNYEWYITEYDHSQKLAFGFINLNDPQMAELGYISINELESLSTTVYRDINFIPKTISQIKKGLGI